MQCAGNRRGELHAIRPVTGDLWTAGAIGNGAWTGVALADVLRAADADTNRGAHVAFEACDTVDGRFCRDTGRCPRTGTTGVGFRGTDAAVVPRGGVELQGLPLRGLAPDTDLGSVTRHDPAVGTHPLSARALRIVACKRAGRRGPV
jgi:DMSO/TMAO reductase YedYZ molybdopterin-dependent catalytic subunit